VAANGRKWPLAEIELDWLVSARSERNAEPKLQTSKINEWLQILASLGVLAGLLLVAYEIRDSNRLATSESVQALDSCFVNISRSEYETNIAEAIVKSFEDPTQLSAAEKLQLNGWLTASISCYVDWQNMYQLGVARYDGIEDLRPWVAIYMSSQFGRAWFDENKFWMYPDMASAIESELAAIPIQTKPPGIASWTPELQSE